MPDISVLDIKLYNQTYKEDDELRCDLGEIVTPPPHANVADIPMTSILGDPHREFKVRDMRQFGAQWGPQFMCINSLGSERCAHLVCRAMSSCPGGRMMAKFLFFEIPQ